MLMADRIKGKVVRVMKSGLFFIHSYETKKDYICHKKFTESKIKEGRYVYFFPADSRTIFDDEIKENTKYMFAEDCKRFSDLTEEERMVLNG